MSEIIIVIIWKAIQGLTSLEIVMMLLAIAIGIIALLMLFLSDFTKLGKNYRWLFFTGGVIFLSAILFVYAPTISSSAPRWIGITLQVMGVLWIVVSISIFTKAVSLRKKLNPKGSS